MKPFYCPSCQKQRRADQVGKVIGCNGSKRCMFFCNRADEAIKQLNKSMG